MKVLIGIALATAWALTTHTIFKWEHPVYHFAMLMVGWFAYDLVSYIKRRMS